MFFDYLRFYEIKTKKYHFQFKTAILLRIHHESEWVIEWLDNNYITVIHVSQGDTREQAMLRFTVDFEAMYLDCALSTSPIADSELKLKTFCYPY